MDEYKSLLNNSNDETTLNDRIKEFIDLETTAFFEHIL